MNALNFPAAILQPPFFDPARPSAMDYGAIGAIIGHEISHSFDDQGAHFDADGRLQNWWTKEDLAHFKASAAQLVAQFDAYQPFPDLARQRQADLEREHRRRRRAVGAPTTPIACRSAARRRPPSQGLTGDQQFFLSFAQSWRPRCARRRRARLLTDGHAPAEYRADTVRNLDAWYAAFDVKPGQKLYLAPADRVRVW